MKYTKADLFNLIVGTIFGIAMLFILFMSLIQKDLKRMIEIHATITNHARAYNKETYDIIKSIKVEMKPYYCSQGITKEELNKELKEFALSIIYNIRKDTFNHWHRGAKVYINE